jgi:(5-formylfuran-3-yl)methyl phosphate synthase
MTGLLVSVRSAAEAKVALAAGADIIDVKEPARGALGASDPEIWRAVQKVVGREAITSAALGELASDEVEELAPLSGGFSFVKIGLANCANDLAWQDRWHSAVVNLPAGVQVVPVAYADWQSAAAPPLDDVLSLAAECPARLLLIDTHDKRAGSLLEIISWPALVALSQAAQRAEVRLALAGSLQLSAISRLLSVRPAYLGFRGAACHGGRAGTIDFARVKSLAEAVQRFGQKVAS